MRWLVAAFALAFPAALAAQANTPSAPTACTVPAGWDDILAQNPRFVVLGEWHGTNEAPGFVANLLCAEAARGQRLLLAVEHGAIYNPAWQAAWALPHDDFRAALPDLGWRRREDGVASEAMLALVLGAHALKQQGARVDIVAFNGARDDAQKARFADLPGQGPHEAAQAENIADAAARKDYDRVIVLVGSLHAEIAPVTVGNPAAAFAPMAMRLAGYGSVISLDMQHAGGTSWSCRTRPDVTLNPGEPVTDEMIRCAAYAHKPDASHSRPPFIDISQTAAKASGGRYHGVFWVGAITASPPALPPDLRQ
ncbi:MAG: hypothetical protein ACJLS3_09455 [Erythrobacter sp.]